MTVCFNEARTPNGTGRFNLIGNLLGAGLILLPAVAMAQDVSPAAPGAGFDVISYDIRLRPDFAGKSVVGEIDIKLRATQDDLQKVGFSDNALFLNRVTVNGRPVVVERAENRLALVLPRPVKAGHTLTVRASYHGAPKRGVNFGPRSVHTAYFACDWMICAQDAVGDKASVRLALTLPKGMTSVGPGSLEIRKPTRTGEEIHVWRERRSYPAYLYAFAAGDYRSAAGRAGPVELAYMSEVAELAEMQRLFAPTAAMLQFFEEKAGVPFPQRRYVQLLVDGGAAQEAVSHSVIGRKVIDPILTTPDEDWVIAHELAHQWWGNLVTCRTLDHFWLNEGITTFMVAAWKEQRWGRAAYDREMEIARRTVARAAAAGVDVPLTYPGSYPTLQTRRAIQYSKGALFMDQLRRELGDEAFWAGLKLFTRTHAGGVADSRDAQAAFEKTSGRDLSAAFDKWVF